MNKKKGLIEITYIGIGLLLLRVGAGSVMMLAHGWPKLMKALGGDPKFMEFLGLSSLTSLWLAVFAEFACSLLVIFGFYTRLSLVPLVFTMSVAAFVAHGDDPWKQKEAALMFLLIFVTLLFTGPGKYSVDAMMEKRR